MKILEILDKFTLRVAIFFAITIIVGFFCSDNVDKIISHCTGAVFVIYYSLRIIQKVEDKTFHSDKDMKEKSLSVLLVGLFGMSLSYVIYFCGYGASNSFVNSVLFDFWTFCLIRASDLLIFYREKQV